MQDPRCLSMLMYVLWNVHRGNGIQLLHRTDEEDEPEFSTWRCHGYSLCQYAITHTGLFPFFPK